MSHPKIPGFLSDGFLPQEWLPNAKATHYDDSVTVEKNARIVVLRLQLMARFKDKIASSPSLADRKTEGSGPINRHGMPQLPVGQHETSGWPVLDLGMHPSVALSDWRFVVDGAVEHK